MSNFFSFWNVEFKRWLRLPTDFDAVGKENKNSGGGGPDNPVRKSWPTRRNAVDRVHVRFDNGANHGGALRRELSLLRHTPPFRFHFPRCFVVIIVVLFLRGPSHRRRRPVSLLPNLQMSTAEDSDLSDRDKVQLWNTDSGMESMTDSNKDVTPVSENYDDDDEEVCHRETGL